MMEKVAIGKAVKIHGFRGQLKINTKFDRDFDIKKIDKLFDEKDVEYVVQRVFMTGDNLGVVVTLENVDLDKAKQLIGTMFYIDRKLVEGKILIEDLKGSVVKFEDDTVLGKIEDVQDYGAAEVIFVQTKCNEQILFPNANGVLVSFDYREKIVVINKARFEEVCDYEN